MSLFSEEDFYDADKDNSIKVDGVYIFLNKRDRALCKKFAGFAAKKSSLIVSTFLKGLPVYGEGTLEIPVGMEARVIITPRPSEELTSIPPEQDGPLSIA